jgi:hypothetical protein
VRDIDLGHVVVPLEEDETIGGDITVRIAADVQIVALHHI